LLTARHVGPEEVTKDPESVRHRVIQGETLVVTQNDRPVAEIRPIEAVCRPRLVCQAGEHELLIVTVNSMLSKYPAQLFS